MKRLNVYITLLTVTFLVGWAQAAHKDVGGGNGVGRILLDRHLYSRTINLDRNQLFLQLARDKKAVFARFPFLKDLASEVIQSKVWILDDRKFSEDCVNPTLSSVQKKVWACQNKVEVRVSRSFWSQASSEQKTDLVFHEVMTALWLKSPDQKPVNLAVASFLDLNLDVYEIQRRVLASGFPIFLVAEQVQYLIDEIQIYSAKSCEFKNERQLFLQWSQSSNRLRDQGLFHYANPIELRIYKNPCENLSRSLIHYLLWQRFKELNPIYFQN